MIFEQRQEGGKIVLELRCGNHALQCIFDKWPGKRIAARVRKMMKDDMNFWRQWNDTNRS